MSFDKNYKYGFKTKFKNSNLFNDKLSIDLIKKISKEKNEPQWMLDIRIKALELFFKLEQPSFGPNLSDIDFEKYVYYSGNNSKISSDWNNIDKSLKETFEKVGVIEAEKNYLDGSSNQFDSETIYKSIKLNLKNQGVIFSNIEEALHSHPEIVKKYFGKLVSYSDNKYAALNTALWSGGSFIFVPKNVKIKNPLQAYFRINQTNLGQFERTLIILEEGASLHYIEGCTAPANESDYLHAAVVEVFVEDYAQCKYSTIQNWSKNVINLVTKRAKVMKKASMSWLDGNIGSRINMKYPCSILVGDYASSDYISIASASKNVIQDTGSKMIHIGKNSKSKIISKSISVAGGINSFRGLVDIKKSAQNSKSLVKCDALLVDGISQADAFPREIVSNDTSAIDHEATISSISEEEINFLRIKGINIDKAEELIILGFISEFDKELPMEYAIELNNLLKLDIENKVERKN